MGLRGERGAKIQIDRTHFHVRGGRNRNIAYVEDRATFTLNATFFFFQETSLQGLTIFTLQQIVIVEHPIQHILHEASFILLTFRRYRTKRWRQQAFLPVRVKKPARAISWSGKPVTTQNIKNSDSETENRKDLSNRTRNVNVTE